MLLQACVALTNAHICLLPLRREDSDTYESYLRRLRDIGLDRVQKRTAVQSRFRENRRHRLLTRMAAHVENVDNTSPRLRQNDFSDAASESEDYMWWETSIVPGCCFSG